MRPARTEPLVRIHPTQSQQASVGNPRGRTTIPPGVWTGWRVVSAATRKMASRGTACGSPAGLRGNLWRLPWTLRRRARDRVRDRRCMAGPRLRERSRDLRDEGGARSCHAHVSGRQSVRRTPRQFGSYRGSAITWTTSSRTAGGASATTSAPPGRREALDGRPVPIANPAAGVDHDSDAVSAVRALGSGRSLKMRMPRYLFIHSCLCG